MQNQEDYTGEFLKVLLITPNLKSNQSSELEPGIPAKPISENDF